MKAKTFYVILASPTGWRYYLRRGFELVGLAGSVLGLMRFWR
ncbi:MAG TPA: hypothetical protein VF297_05045 [Pyrinomonadaceae bacterium]